MNRCMLVSDRSYLAICLDSMCSALVLRVDVSLMFLLVSYL